MRRGLDQRLVTQNLLALASFYEREKQVSWSAIQQLSTLIDIACLYTQIRVVGRQAYSIYPNSDSPLFKALHGIVSVDEFSNAEQESAAISLAAFMADADGPDRYKALIASTCSPASIERAVRMDPELKDDFTTAHTWLKGLSPGVDPDDALRSNAGFHRSVTFLVRSFLYIAYAAEKVVPFAPDAVRADALAPVIAEDQRWRQAILDSIKPATAGSNLYANINVSRNITPLATIVFRRAKRKEEIGEEILKLREELASTRSRLVEAEDEMYFATQQTEARAQARWNKVIDELKAQFQEGESVVSWRSVSGFAEKGAEAALDLGKLVRLIGLPIEMIRRYLARRPVIELHRVAKTLPGSRARAEDIDRLFGRVVP